MRRLAAISLVLAGLGAWVFQESTRVDAQSGTRTAREGVRTAQAKGRPKTPAEFQAAFWRYLTKGPVGYDEWGPFPGREPDLYEGRNPHGAFLKLFANKIARANPAKLPHGSILVKENYGPDGETLMAVTVMYRARDFNPDHHDWYWIKYRADGTVDRTPPDQGDQLLAGRVAGCIDCHSGAEGGDYSFAND